MSKQHQRISKKLQQKGAAWAVRSDKHVSPNDPMQDQIDGRKTWHVHPDASHPHQGCILRFDTLAEIEKWLS